MDLLEVARFLTPLYECSYLPTEMARLDYRLIPEVSTADYEDLLRRGWRRFGCYFFRPRCPSCHACRSLRVVVDDFRPSRSQRRALKRNSHIEFVMQPPTVTAEHVRLYNDWHVDMHARRNWAPASVSQPEYEECFLRGDFEFSRELLFLDDGKLIGVSLVDLVPSAVSSVYFFHDPAWRPAGPGVYSALRELEFCRSSGRAHLYLGFWVAACQSMAYKANYQPHEILRDYCGDNDLPVWDRQQPVQGS